MISIFRKFFLFSGSQKKNFYISLVYAFFLAAFSALRIFAIAVVLEAITDHSMTVRTPLTALGILLVSIAGDAVMRNRTVVRQTVGGYTMCAEKRVEIGERLKYMPMGYFNKNNLGTITSITTNTAEGLQDVATRVIQMYLQGMINTSVITLFLFFFDVRIGLLTLCGILAFLLVNHFMQRASRKISPKKIEADAKLVDAVLEYVQGIGVVKSYNLGSRANRKVEGAIDEANGVCFGMEKTFVPYQSLQTLVLKLFGVGVILASVLFYVGGTMPLLSALLMIVCSFIIYAELETAGLYSALLRVINLSVDKIEEIFKSPVMDEKGSAIKPEDFTIEAKHVGFSYEKRRILDDVGFTIPQGTTTAIVGPSGGGKTTLCSLIARFWDVDDGAITLGGKDIRDYTLDSLLKNISMVFQNVYLFNDTIANNIKFGRPGATMEEVAEAARKACCDTFIDALPGGYDTVLGEGGATLSGGERQRISIARAMLKDAPVIILDEATANVDPENENKLQQAIAALTRDKTIVMIAHRLKTVRHADQILVVDEGRIVQRGTHEELIRQQGIYSDFIGVRKKAIGWKLKAKNAE